MADSLREAAAQPARARAAKALRVAAALLIVVFAVAAAAWLAIGGDGGGGQPPLIVADPTPERAPPDPDKPNGAVIPHQGEIVYEVVDGADKPSEDEAMAPAPERPLSPPETGADDVSPPPPIARAEADPPQEETPSGPVQLLPPDPEPDVIGALPPANAVKPADPMPEAPTAEAERPATDVATEAASAADRDAPMPPAEAQAVEPVAEATPEAPAETPPEPPAASANAEEKPPEQVAALPPDEPAPAEEAAAPDTPVGTPAWAYRIQLGAVRDRATAQREWRRLRDRHSDILGGLQLFIQQVNIPGRGEFHRIQAGPLPEKIVAELACDQLISRKAACFVIAK